MLRRVRRGSIFQLLGIAAIVAVITSLVAVLIPWLPNPASEEAKRIHFVYWFTTVICIGVFAVVTAPSESLVVSTKYKDMYPLLSSK